MVDMHTFLILRSPIPKMQSKRDPLLPFSPRSTVQQTMRMSIAVWRYSQGGFAAGGKRVVAVCYCRSLRFG